MIRSLIILHTFSFCKALKFVNRTYRTNKNRRHRIRNCKMPSLCFQRITVTQWAGSTMHNNCHILLKIHLFYMASYPKEDCIWSLSCSVQFCTFSSCVSLFPFFPFHLSFLPRRVWPLTAHWLYMALARKTRRSTSALLRTAPAPHRPVPASRCSGLMACPVCPPKCRPRPCHPPPSGCPGRSLNKTLRTSSVMCSTSAGPQVRSYWRSK